MIMMDDWEQKKRDVAKLENLHAQMSGRKKEILRRLKQFGIKSLKEGIAAKKDGHRKEVEAAVRWQKAVEAFEPVYEEVKSLLEEME